jgi:Molecular chaperone, HSP90 family
MKEGQQKIYYITGRSREEIDASPHLEGFKSRDIEVLILSDPIDDFWVNMVHEFDGTAMASVTRAGEELKEVAKKDQDDRKDDTKAADGGAMVPEVKKATLVAAIRQALKDDVADVKLSERLTDSPVCLVADHGGIDLNLEKILAAQGQSIQAKRILEINPDHPYILGLARRSEEKGFADEVREPARLLHDLARVMDGEAPSKPKEFVKAITSLLQK